MIGLGFVIAGAILFFLMGRISRKGLQTNETLLFSPLLLTVAIIILGVAMRHDASSRMPAPHWPAYAIYGLLILQLPLAAVLIKQSKGQRGFAIFVIALQILCSLYVAFVAGMAVTGSWL